MTLRRFGAEHLGEVKSQIVSSERIPGLDLEEVDLADREAVRFLVSVKKDGIEARNAFRILGTN